MNARKLVIASSVILFAVCAPALAGTPPPQAAPVSSGASSPPATRSVAIAVEVKDAAAALHYGLSLETDQCGSIDDVRAAGDRDLVEICLSEVANGIGIRVSWRDSRGASTYTVKASAVTTAGKPFTIGRDGGPRLTVSWK